MPRAARLAFAATVFAAALAPVAARAAAPITVKVDRTSIRAGDTLRLEVAVSTASRQPRRPRVRAPDLSDWRLVGRYERTTYDGMTGRSVTTLTLMLQPRRTGSLTIGPFELPLEGRTHRTKPIRIEVHGDDPAAAGPPDDDAPAAGGPAAAPADDAFVAWEVDRTEAWLGEQLQATLYIYVDRGHGTSQITLADVNLEGFWSQQHDRRSGLSRGELVQVGGRIFRRQELVTYTLFPIRTGTLQLPPARVEMVLSEQFFLGRGNAERTVRTAEPLAIEVRPLPEAGRPADFAGPAVGDIRLRARVDRTAIHADEGVQLTVITEVDGLLQNVPRVTLPEMPDFKVFPPTESENAGLRGDRVAGRRRTTWLLRPLKGGRLTIPAVRLPYFDPASGTYREATTAPLTITVKGRPKPLAAGGDDGGDAAEADGPALRTIRKIDALRAEARPAYRSPLFAAAVALPPLLLLGLVVGERVRTRRAGDAPARAARRAAAEARRALDRLRSAADTADAFAGIARTLLRYLEARFGEPFNGMTHDQLARRLRILGVDPATAADFVAELENCDFARFAPAATRADELNDALKRATALVARVEEAVRR